MQIFKKTHEKKLDIDNPISFSIDEIIDSLDPGFTFVINNLFLYTINEDFSQINFHLLVNEKCVAVILYDVKSETFTEKHTKEIYKNLLKDNLNKHKNELSKLKESLLCRNI